MLGHAVHVLALKADGAFAANQPQNRQTKGGFTGTAFTNNAQGLALMQAEVDAVHRFHIIDRTAQQAFLDRKPHPQVFDLQNWLAGRVGDWLAAGLGTEQFLGVRMLRIGEQLIARRLFDDHSALHDTYTMGNSLNQIEIVGNQQQGHAQACLQILEQFEDF